MKLGLIDLGSNSARMYLVSLSGGRYEILARRRVMTRLSEGMGEEHVLQENAIERTIQTLQAFGKEMKAEDAYPFAIATAAVRHAANKTEFISRVRRDAGFDLMVLSGQTEAQFDFLGVMAGLSGISDGLICDTGGGSTELILAKNGMMQAKTSLPFGAMTLTDAYGTDLLAGKSYLLQHFAQISFLSEAKGLPLLGIGGSVCAFGHLERRDKNIHGYSISRGRCRELFDTLLPLTPEQRSGLGIEPGRADTICAGFFPSLLLMEDLSLPHITLCTSGLREGILAELTKDNPETYAKNPELFLEKYV